MKNSTMDERMLNESGLKSPIFYIVNITLLFNIIVPSPDTTGRPIMSPVRRDSTPPRAQEGKLRRASKR